MTIGPTFSALGGARYVSLTTFRRSGEVESRAGRAKILTGDADTRRPTAIIRRTYQIEYRLFMVVERLVQRGQSERVIPRIRPASREALRRRFSGVRQGSGSGPHPSQA